MIEYGLVTIWLLTYLGLGVLGLPIASLFFRQFPDRGASVAIPLSLGVVTLVVLWVGHLAFNLFAIAVGLSVLVAGTIASIRLVDATLNWRTAGETAVVFGVAFLFVVAMRAVDPAVHPLLGEKFLDFGMLQTLLRADALPPEDFWFAGHSVAYYYGGHLSAALLATLTDTVGRYTYNLALAGFYAMLVTGAFGLGGTLADARDASWRLGGLFAAFFVGLASNLEPVAEALADILPRRVIRAIVSPFVSNPEKILGDNPFTYWDASRVIPGTVNEFPLFAWLNGDMHGHMMSPAFMLVVVASLIAYFRTPEAERARRRLLVFGGVPAVGGLLAAINTWSFPTVMGLTALALLFADAHPVTLLPEALADRIRPAADSWVRREAVRVLVAGALAISVEILAALWALPFLLGPASPRRIAVVTDRSGLGVLLLVHGAFLAVGALYLLDRAPFENRSGLLQVLLIGVAGVAVTTLIDAVAVGLFLPFILGSGALLRWDVDVGFEAVLFVAGVGLALLVEFGYVVENAGPGRFNTVFKLYAQVWVFLAVASGAMLAALWATAARRPSFSLGGIMIDRSVLVRTFTAVLIVSTSVYGVLALQQHFAGNSMYARYQTVENPTLDALQFVKTGHPEEAEAIFWMKRHIEEQPNIVTAAPAGYYWGPEPGGGIGGAAAPASLTGIPTVAGWHHAADFHDPQAYRRRVADVRFIYTRTSERQARLIRKYNIAYVYFGPAERERYGSLSGNTTVDDLQGVRLVKKWESVRLYRVEESALPT